MSNERTSFRSTLETSRLVLLDGAMGTELDKRGVAGRCTGNLSNPESVVAVHRSYVEAGSTVIMTNTLTMNRIFVESHNLEIDVRKVNAAGAALAREAAGNRVSVLGNLSSTGQMLEPYGTWSEQTVVDSFKEQVGCLADGGVDGFIIETMFDLREAVCALRACRAAADLPVIVCIAYNTAQNGGRTVMGNSAAECARILEAEGAHAVGANCGNIDPDQMALIIRAMASETRLPVAAEPNAGMPRLVNGATVFDMEPEAFASGVVNCMNAGARVLGGCCGTTPQHIRALAAALRRKE